MSKSSKKFPKISANVRTREAHSRGVLRKQIRESSGMARWQAWEAKRAYGWHTRHLLLTYAIIRGLPYAACERAAAESPSASEIANLAAAYGYEVSDDTALEWLKGNPIPTVQLLPPVAAPVQVQAAPVKKEGFFASLVRRFA